MMKGIFWVVLLSGLGFPIGFAAGWGLWEMANPNHAPDDSDGAMFGALLGIYGSVAIGFIGAILLAAIRWFRHPSKTTPIHENSGHSE
jgi:hypothetical protein